MLIDYSATEVFLNIESLFALFFKEPFYENVKDEKR